MVDQPDVTEDIHILLVDDENDFRQIIAKRLKRRGIEVREADRGEKALQMLEDAPVDVVIMDVKMPGMDGIECLKRIKEKYDLLEVIMLTGHADIHGGVEGIKSGAFDYLSKPIELEHLVRKIKQAFHKIQRILAEKEARAFKEQVQQQMVVAERLVALGTMASGVAHEINNPLAVIQDSAGWLQQILEKPDMQGIPRRDDFNKGLERINKAVKRAGKITQQLLQAVKTQTTEMADPSTFVEVDLKKLSEEAITLVEPEAALKNIVIHLETKEPRLSAWTDSLQLLQVLLNLLSNSIQATEEGGRIIVRLNAAMEEAKIIVKDTGCGISKENISRIFEPFFTTKEADQGTGMGLYVSWGIITGLGGLISVESEVNKGTTFTITLPVKK
ncbi:sensor histidine kinase [Desulfotignum phosphitoxidans]|jgi:signal transduction histidine kinase|uniref:sensor histidine kinase n=1 Tax=Desulfotignum phosphitoxidans TaxID=190898 RepID=UPI00034C7447|nr:response regulator [Desulfotignum phosphitoxidans]